MEWYKNEEFKTIYHKNFEESINEVCFDFEGFLDKTAHDIFGKVSKHVFNEMLDEMLDAAKEDFSELCVP